MAFLQPLAFLLAASFGVLLWLWRFQQRRYTVVIPSLIPFAELPERQPRWSWPRVNWLFWLQAALLLCLILGAARWVWYRRVAPRPATDYVLMLDTSASMRAVEHGRPRMEIAKQRALAWARDLSAADRVTMWTTAPAQPVTSGWVQDHRQTRQAIHAARATDLPGALETAVGLASHTTDPQHTTRWIIITDEPEPASLPSEVRWMRVGQPAANVAITGFEMHRPLLTEAASREGWLTVWNAADRPQRITVRVTADQTTIATSTVALAAQERRSLLMAQPPQTEGLWQATIEAQGNVLRSDDTVRAALKPPGPLRIAVAPSLTALASALRRLQPRIEVVAPSDASAQLQITDTWMEATPRVPTLTLQRGQVTARPVDWTSAHPLMRYLDGFDRLRLTQAQPLEVPHWGEPVAWATPTAPTRSGGSFPCVVIGTQGGVRRIVAGWDLAVGSDGETTDAWIFLLNALSWLSADTHTALVPTGSRLPSGAIAVMAGPAEDRYAYLADPREINTMEPASTWAAPPRPDARQGASGHEGAMVVPPTPWPLWWWCWLAAVALICFEWWCYWWRLRLSS